MAVFTAIGTALGVSAGLWGGAAAFGAGLATTAAVAGAGVAGGMMLGGMGKQKALPGQQMPNMPNAPKLEDASKNAKLAADERRRAMARSESTQTNPLGLKDEDKANVARKRLLGG